MKKLSWFLATLLFCNASVYAEFGFEYVSKGEALMLTMIPMFTAIGISAGYTFYRMHLADTGKTVESQKIIARGGDWKEMWHLSNNEGNTALAIGAFVSSCVMLLSFMVVIYLEESRKAEQVEI